MAYEISKKLNIRPQYNSPVVVHVSSGDSGIPITFEMYDGNEPYTIPSGSVISVQGTRKDGASWITTATANGSEVTFTSPSAMAAVEGAGIAEVSITGGGETYGSANFLVLVERATIPNGVSYSSDPSVFQDILNYVKSGIAQGMAEATSGAVAEWLEDNITPTTPVVDASLSVAGAAADAKVTGTIARDVTTENNVLVDVNSTTGQYWTGGNTWSTNNSTLRYDMFTLPAGTYYYEHLYAYFCFYRPTGGSATRFSSVTRTNYNGTITLSEPCEIYITKSTANTDIAYITGNQYLLKKASNKNAKYYPAPDKSALKTDSNLISETYTAGKYWTGGGTTQNNETLNAYAPFTISPGTYYFRNLYSYFCFYQTQTGPATRFQLGTQNFANGTLTFDDYATIWITSNGSRPDLSPLFTDDLKLYNSGFLPKPGDDLIDGSLMPVIVPHQILVNSNGNGDFTTVKAAIEYANTIASKSTPVIISIANGTYDLLNELGGTAFVQAINSESSTRSGININPYITIVGLGYVLLTYLPDDNISTYASTERVSPFEVWGQVKMENIHIRAKNCRYCVHDESNNNNLYEESEHTYYNCYFEHLGNIDNGWVSSAAVGQGSSRGNKYIFKDSILKSAEFYAYRAHNNADQYKSNTITFDGCTLEGTYQGYSARISYYGSNTVEANIFIKSSKADAPILINSESAGSVNVYNVHNYTDIEVTVT